MADEEGSDNQHTRPSRRRLLQVAGLAVTSGLAGCPDGDGGVAGTSPVSTDSGGGEVSESFEATPYRLPGAGMAEFRFREASHETAETVRSMTGAEGTAAFLSHEFSYGTDASVPEAVAWSASPGGTWSAGVVSTPLGLVDEEATNLVATQAVSTLLVEDTGAEFRSTMGLRSGESWTCGPTKIGQGRAEILGQEMPVETFVGVREGPEGLKGVAVNAGRVRTDSDAVLVGNVDRRRVTGEVGASDCIDRTPGDEAGSDLEGEAQKEWIRKRLERFIRMAERLEEDDGDTDDGFDFSSLPDVSASTLRLVQTVEGTELDDGSGSTKSIEDVPLVRNQPVAPVFEIDGQNVEQLWERGEEVRARFSVTSTQGAPNAKQVGFWVDGNSLEEIVEGSDSVAIFARQNDPTERPPVFDLTRDADTVTVDLELTPPDGAWPYDTVSGKTHDIVDVDSPLRVGFIEVVDPGGSSSPRLTQSEAERKDKKYTTDIDWGDANGRAKNYERSVRSSYEFIRRVFPGDVVAYRHDTSMVGLIRENWNDATTKDAKRARSTLNEVSESDDFPSDGTIFAKGLTATSEEPASLMDADEGGGFDVRVMILPKGTASDNGDYFDLHWGDADKPSGLLGYHWNTDTAVGSLEALANSNDLSHVSTTAQEIGHRFASDPYDDGSDDPFSRTADIDDDGSTEDDLGHANKNLQSVGYDLTGRDFDIIGPEMSTRDALGSFDPGGPVYTDNNNRVVGKFPSYMSYTDGVNCADNRIHSFLAEGNYEVLYGGNSDGSGSGAGAAAARDGSSVQPVLAGYGSIVDGEIQFEESWVYDAIPADTGGSSGDRSAGDSSPVEIELHGPDEGDEPLVDTVVSDRYEGTHHRVHETPTFSLPFPELAVSLVATRGDTTVEMNPIIDPLRDALARVPASGVVEGEDSLSSLRGVLDDAAGLMDEGAYGDAARMLDGPFRETVRTEVREEYDRFAGEPGVEELTALTQRMVDRLDTLADDSESDSPSPVLSLSPDMGVTTDSEGRVETWADQSGNGYDYAASSPASRPTVTEDAVNGHRALAFDGDTDHLMREDTMGIANDSARTFVVVSRLAETTPRSPFIMQGELGSETQFYGLEANTFDTAGEQFGVYAIGSSHDSDRATDTNYHVHTLRTESFSDRGEVINTTTYHINGQETSLTQVSSDEGSGTSFAGEQTAIGAFPVEGTPQVTHDGEIAAVRVYDRALTDSEREQVESDLMDTYGIGKPPATPTATLELPNGGTRCVSPVEGQSPVSEYYGFDEDETRSASTPAELAVDNATVSFLYRNGQTGNLSLVVIHGNASGTTDGGGKAIMTFDGVSGTEWLVQDGPPGNDAYTTADGTLGSSESASWSWPDDRADGGAIGTLGDGFEITLTHRQEGTVGDSSASRSGLDRWLFVDGSDIENPIELATLADAGDVSVRISSGCQSDG